ncbi:unnamed protein product [Musa hybrid cultivar]
MNITLTRSKFETLVNHLIGRTINPCKSCLKDASVSTKDVDEVLVGGMTRVPKVQETVLEIFGKIPTKGGNPDEVVAMGNETLGGIFTRLINRNTTIPTKKSQVRFSSNTFFFLWIKVLGKLLQNSWLMVEIPMIKDVPRLLVTGTKHEPTAYQTFGVDSRVGCLCFFSAKDKANGKEQQITIRSSGGLSEDEIETMVKEAELHAQEQC